ncbi:MAG: hypothetical protein ABI910_02845 [Gemmatimonadota bacterium]
MAESFFLSSIANYLSTAGLLPALRLSGVAEPELSTELPAIVLSLESSARENPGLGERGELMRGALPVQANIDLANPVLPAEPGFSLLDATRRVLILPHGGLVRQDGSDPGDAPLAAADIAVTVAGTAQIVVAGAPAAGAVRADPRVGTLTFGAALPASGVVFADYRLGQWEQRLERIAGTLRLDVCAANASDAIALSDGAVQALLDPRARSAVRRLIALQVQSLGSVAAPSPTPASRRRTARFTFTFEREINRPDSSGGVISRIPVTAHQGDGGTPPAPLPQGTEHFTIPA